MFATREAGLRPGEQVPSVTHVQTARIPAPDEPVITFDVPLPPAEGGVDWVVLRIADPARPNGQPGPAGHAANTYGLAYSSLWWLA